MKNFYCALCLTLLFTNVTAASTINMDIEESGGSFAFDADDVFIPIAGFSGTDGAGSLYLNSAGDGSESVLFELSVITQDVLLTYVNADRVLLIAESVVVSGEFSNGIYTVNSIQYNWHSCEEIQGDEGCDSFSDIAPMSATLTQSGEALSLIINTHPLLQGYLFNDPFSVTRQLGLTPVPVPAAIWFLVSALATLRWLGYSRARR